MTLPDNLIIFIYPLIGVGQFQSEPRVNYIGLSKALTMYERSIGIVQLGYTFSSFSPDNDPSIQNTVDFINKYIVKYQGVRIITDFDG